MQYDMGVYINGKKKDNMRFIRLEFDSNLSYTLVFDRSASSGR